MKSSNTVWHHATITRQHRERQSNHKSVIIWFTGLSGSGKSTLAHAVEDSLYRLNCRTFVVDGDNVRHGLCGDLGFSHQDREENIRRVGEVAKLFIEAGVIVLTAFISPFRSSRELVRGLVPHGEFIEIYCKCNIETCEQRDTKGLYARARCGEIPDFTGISSPYEIPVAPDLTVDTGTLSLEASASLVLNLLKTRGIIGS